MIPVIIEIILFIILLYTFYKVSVSSNVSNFSKWVLTFSSVGILFLADKVKLLVWICAVGVLLLIKHFTTKRQKNGRTA